MSELIDPLKFEFFRNALYVATLSGALCGLVGVYVVLRGMSYIGHGLSHAIFGGAIVSYVAKINFYVGAGAWGFVSAIAVGRVARRRWIGADAAIGVVTTASFAFGLAIVSKVGSFTRNFDAALFGNVLGVTIPDVVAVAAVMLMVAAIVVRRYRSLMFVTFDPDVAEASGVNVARIDVLFSFMLAATVVVTMNILGVLLVAAQLVIPAVIARMLTNSFGRMMKLSILIGAVCGLAGVYVSYFVDVASGPSVVLTSSALFVIVYVLTGARGRRRVPVGAID